MSAPSPSKIGKTILEYLSRTGADEVDPGFISRYELMSITGFGSKGLRSVISRLLKFNKAERRLFRVVRDGRIKLVAHYKFSPDIEKMMRLPKGRVGLPRGISRKSPMRSPRTTTFRPTLRECKNRK